MATGTSHPTTSSWFVVLPDTDAVAGHAARLRSCASRELPHASGRPWLIGRWSARTLTTARCGGSRVAVIGQHAVTAEEAERAARTGSSAGVERVAARWPGSHHLLASLDGQVLVRGTVSGVRTVFFAAARPSRAHLASDRADVLADLVGADLDERRLAVQLLSPGILHPLTAQSVWHGVDVLPGDRRLQLDRDGCARTGRCWSPPPPELPLTEGARLVRDRLAAAVAARTGGHDLISADLGGVDSTAVVCTAVRAEVKLVAYTAAVHDVLGDDVAYARRTVEALGGVEHRVVPAQLVPLTFDGVDTLDDILDTPSLHTVNRHRRMYIVEQAARHGSPLHLSGMGGDELFSGASAHVHGLLARHPRTAWRHTRGFTSKHRWSRRAALRQLIDRQDYGSWLRLVARDLTCPQPDMSAPMFEWGIPPRLPPWATARAVDAVRDLVLEQAGTAKPLDTGHGGHRELATLRTLARFSRHVDQMSEPLGTTFASPYYDDALVEVALAVRPEERVTPWRYKPLIEEAMRGVVPETSRHRTTKAHAAFEEETGLRRHRASLLALWEDSRLDRLGLVDVDALRAWCLRPLAADLECALLHPTVGCEVWLRSRESRRSGEAPRSGDDTAPADVGRPGHAGRPGDGGRAGESSHGPLGAAETDAGGPTA
ncbi:asparagine synthase-related protein [Streptomyces sp. NPDC086783]|uniref:asparagine synthase-related protein n=1 Tax=Streptomyces sp. NPDC086783 TaxID=3365758 RepID=UPI0037F7D1B8